MRRVHKIYRLTFEIDGAQYVGRTITSFRDRLQRHKGGSGNAEVSARMRAGEIYKAKILHEAKTIEDAKRLELQEIRKLTKPINCCGIMAEPVWRPGTPPPRLTHPLMRYDKVNFGRCSLCRKIKPAKEFHSDRSRHNGLNSRCKECSFELHCGYNRRKATSTKAERSIGYQQAKRKLQERYANA